jgi:hypothetical protein
LGYAVQSFPELRSVNINMRNIFALLLIASILLVNTVSSETVSSDNTESADPKTDTAYDECSEFPNIAVLPFTRRGLYLVAWKHGGHVYWKLHLLFPQMRLELSDLREMTSPPMSTLVTHTLETLKAKHSLTDASSLPSLNVQENNILYHNLVELTDTHKTIDVALLHPPIFQNGKNVSVIWQLSAPVLDETDWYSLHQSKLRENVQLNILSFWQNACDVQNRHEFCKPAEDQYLAFNKLWS